MKQITVFLSSQNKNKELAAEIIGKDWRDAFNRKVAGIATFSGGEGMNLIIGLRTQLAYVGLTVIGRTLQVNYKKPLNPDSLVDFTVQIASRV